MALRISRVVDPGHPTSRGVTPSQRAIASSGRMCSSGWWGSQGAAHSTIPMRRRAPTKTAARVPSRQARDRAIYGCPRSMDILEEPRPDVQGEREGLEVEVIPGDVTVFRQI